MKDFSTIIKSNGNKEERTKEIQSLSPEEQVQYLCPEGVMPLEEFRRIGIQMINDMYEEK